jgi:hypothetical protein
MVAKLNLMASTQTDISPDAEDNIYEKLARAKALWMYQVLRVFDGDIGRRAQAEQDMTTLKLWLLELEKYKDNLGEICLLDEAELRRRTPSSWEVCALNH